jgi:AmmeMemoRadiSam system protein B
VAGSFYPDDPHELRELVRSCLGSGQFPRTPAPAAIAPHAGLAYSGPCAGAVFARLAIPATVVVLAPNHTGVLTAPGGASVWARGAFQTPLGNAPVAAEFAARLIERCPLAANDTAAHRAEHAVEVEIPFLQVLAPGAAIVPILLAWDDWDRCRVLADALAGVIGGWPSEVLVLASSDMTHYESAASAARKDRLALAAVERLDGEALLDICRRERVTMCGRAPAAVALETARRLGASRGTVVDYRHSGLVTGDDSRVVSYAGVMTE